MSRRVLREQDAEWGNAANVEEHRRNAQLKAGSGRAGLIKELWQGVLNRQGGNLKGSEKAR